MILIARALASRPDLMILDEPTSALDFKNQNRVLNIIKRIADEGQAVVFTTHCPHQALHVADLAMIMQSKKSYMWGQEKDVLSRNHLSNLYDVDIHTGTLQADNKSRNFVTPLFR